MPDYTPGLEAIDNLEKHNGDMKRLFKIYDKQEWSAMMGDSESLSKSPLKPCEMNFVAMMGFVVNSKNTPKIPGIHR